MVSRLSPKQSSGVRFPQRPPLLLGLFVRGGGPAPVAKLLELDFAGDEFLIFRAPIVDALAFGALQFYESIL